MIKFFRHIRQRLLAENRFSKYLIYALGEIVLVVVGILIALQINNYNSHREQRKMETKYLIALQTEFNHNLKKINTELEENQERVDAVNELMPLFDKRNADTVSNETISKLFSTIFASSLKYEPSMGVLNDIISSGNLNLFQNPKLREHLAAFQSLLGFYKLQENMANAVKDDLRKLFYKQGSVRNIMKSFGSNFDYHSISDKANDRALFNSLEFENYLLDYYMTFRGANNDYYLGGIKKNIQEILDEVSDDLNK